MHVNLFLFAPFDGCNKTAVNFGNQLINNPLGLPFLKPNQDIPSEYLEQITPNCPFFSVICSGKLTVSQ